MTDPDLAEVKLASLASSECLEDKYIREAMILSGDLIEEEEKTVTPWKSLFKRSQPTPRKESATVSQVTIQQSCKKLTNHYLSNPEEWIHIGEETMAKASFLFILAKSDPTNVLHSNLNKEFLDKFGMPFEEWFQAEILNNINDEEEPVTSVSFFEEDSPQRVKESLVQLSLLHASVLRSEFAVSFLTKKIKSFDIDVKLQESHFYGMISRSVRNLPSHLYAAKKSLRDLVESGVIIKIDPKKNPMNKSAAKALMMSLAK